MEAISDLRDRELVAAVQAGDSSAYGELFERYQQKIYSFTYGILGNADDARDVTQDAFVRVFEALPKKSPDEVEFAAYLYRAARNASYDVAKARGRFTSPEALETVEESTMDAHPERATLFAEQQDVVRRALSSLPEDYRAVLLLREVQEMSYAEIAEALDMPRNTAGVMIMRARLKFKEAFRMAHVDAETLCAECQAMLPKLSAYIDDELKPADRAKVETHLADCPLCRLALDEMRESSKSYRAILPLIPLAPSAIKAGVMARVPQMAGPGGASGSGATSGTGAGAGPGGAGAAGGNWGGWSGDGSGGGPAGPDAGDGLGSGGEQGVGAGVGTGGRLASLMRTQKVLLAVVGLLAIVALGAVVGSAMFGGPATTAPTWVAVATSTVETSADVSAESTVAATGAPVIEPVDDQAPPAPKQVSPASGSQVAPGVTLKWTAVKDPSGVTYSVEVQQFLGGGAGWEQVALAGGLTKPQFATEATGMTRRWRVWAVDGAGNASAKSGWWDFVLAEASTPGTGAPGIIGTPRIKLPGVPVIPNVRIVVPPSVR